jgi:hypothetical protein
MKRKAESEPASAASSTGFSLIGEPTQPPTKIPRSRQSSTSGAPALAEGQVSRAKSQAGSDAALSPSSATAFGGQEEQQKADLGSGQIAAREREEQQRRIVEMAGMTPSILPAGRVFPIQVGCELFKLSGASIASDGKFFPVYMSTWHNS